MAPHPFWEGHLKLSLVSCAVALVSAASESGRVHFHILDRASGHRVESRYVDAETGAPVEAEDQVKGCRYGAHGFVMLEDEELAAIAPETTRTIEIATFVEKEAVGWIWYDQPYYLLADDPAGEEAFSVIRAAMAESGVVGIARLVLRGRERAVMLEPRGRGIVLWTLRSGDEVRDAAAGFAGIGGEKLDPKLVSLVSALIAARRKRWDPAMMDDPVEARLRDIIAARRKGRRVRRAKPAARPAGNVISIMDALRRSIAAEKKKPEKRAHSA